MSDSANDEFFSIRKQLRSLDEEQIVSLVGELVDRNCSELDAQYWKRVIGAGAESQEVTRQYAAQGSPAAQAVLGTALLHGQFTEKGVAQGLFWLRRAHNNGNTKASIVLGSAYFDGSLQRDARKGAEYIAGAARAGDQAAQHMYALLLIDGDGVAQDENEAIAWLRRAAERDHEKAIELLQANDIPLHDS